MTIPPMGTSLCTAGGIIDAGLDPHPERVVAGTATPDLVLTEQEDVILINRPGCFRQNAAIVGGEALPLGPGL